MKKIPRSSPALMHSKTYTNQEKTGVSHRALTVARLIDRLCRAPGTYTITFVVPAHSRAPWEVHYHRVELIRSMEIGRR